MTAVKTEGWVQAEALRALPWRHGSQLDRAIDIWGRLVIAGPPPDPMITFIRTDFANHGVAQVFDVRPDGSLLANLTNDPLSFDDTPAWSPDRSQIVFARTTSGAGPQALWVMQADGTQQRQLTYPPAGNSDVEPRWSPDGSTIAFQRFWSIWLMNSDGTNVRELPASQNMSPPALHHMPSWNPDGTEIAFCRESGGLAGIAVADVNGGANQYQMLTANPHVDGFDAWPAWSPDGTKVAFSRNDGNAIRIWTVDASGNAASEVALSNPDKSHIDQAPCWSPSGDRLAFARTGGYPYTTEIWLMDAGGGNETNLSALIGHSPSVADWFPNWK